MRPDEIKSATHFDDDSTKYASLYRGRDPAAHSFRARRASAHAMLGHGPLGRLLDAGGGPGVYFDDFKAQVDTYDLVDISPGMIAAASRIDGGRVPLRCQVASVYSLPYPAGSFDTVLAMGLLEYLDEPWKALEEIARVTKPGGIVLASFPNAHGFGRRLSKILYRFCGRSDPFGQEFTVDQVVKVAGLADLECMGRGGYNAQIIPWPFTWRMQRVAYGSSKLLEPLLAGSKIMWGSGFNLKLRKRPGVQPEAGPEPSPVIR